MAKSKYDAALPVQVQIPIDEGDEKPQPTDLPPVVSTLISGVCCLGLFVGCVAMMCLVAFIVVQEHDASIARRHVKPPPVEPFRVVAHSIWRNWIHEFFHVKKTFNEALGICRSRAGELLHFNISVTPQAYINFVNPEFESRFDAFVAQNFWKESDYPDLKYWTGHFWVTRRDRFDFGYFRTLDDHRIGRLFSFAKVHKCRVIGEGQMNALLRIDAWQEKHLIKDYVVSHQYLADVKKNESEPEKTESRLGEDMMQSGRGCYNIISREDLTPEHSYYFVCQRPISPDTATIPPAQKPSTQSS